MTSVWAWAVLLVIVFGLGVWTGLQWSDWQWRRR